MGCDGCLIRREGGKLQGVANIPHPLVEGSLTLLGLGSTRSPAAWQWCQVLLSLPSASRTLHLPLSPETLDPPVSQPFSGTCCPPSFCGLDSFGVPGHGALWHLSLCLAHVTAHCLQGPFVSEQVLVAELGLFLLWGYGASASSGPAVCHWPSLFTPPTISLSPLGPHLLSSLMWAGLTLYAEGSRSPSSPLQDNGNSFTYTGSGGRDLSGNKRTAGQSSDQKLTNTNRCVEAWHPVEGGGPMCLSWQQVMGHRLPHDGPLSWLQSQPGVSLPSQ